VSVLVNDPDFTLYVGDVLEQLRELPDESVHCVVTSPPYWGLRCYGVDGQYGLEATPDLFVARMVEVFREVRRVLRADGTCWINLGDSYAQGGKRRDEEEGERGEFLRVERQKIRDDDAGVYAVPTGWGKRGDRAAQTATAGLKPKDLVGIPWRVAFALQADGWYLRSDIVWAKPNPMPESVTDRPTKAHEYVFLLTRSPRYFFDQEAVREAMAPASEGRYAYAFGGAKSEALTAADANGAGSRTHPIGMREPTAGRNVRSVWEIATQPYPEAHFATFPEALPDRCIRAGTSERGCCPVCGAPWVRETIAHPDERKPYRSVGTGPKADEVRADGNRKNKVLLEDGSGGSLAITRRETVGWQASCRCGSTHVSRSAPFPQPVPCTILDPFMGSGTTALVARRLGRRSIGIELNLSYAELAARRLQQLSLFAGEPA
jgi:DNA modification methylase